MSLRALGRQFKAAKARHALRNAPYIPPSETFPQGHLFAPWEHGGKQPIFDAQTREAARRRMAGENNPEAPWREPHWSDKWAAPKPGAPTYKQLSLFDDE